jgi:hypothetical protein
MSLLAVRIGAGVLALLALIALRGKRWAYFAFVVLGLLYYPAQAHFQLHAPKCEQILPTLQQIVPLLHNYLYLALFAGFYWMSWVQLRYANARVFWALVATLLAAALFEIADGMTVVVAVAKTARHAKAVAAAAPLHCRVQDLVPAVAGAIGAAVLLAIWARLTKKPAYVALGKKPGKAAARPLPPAPRSPLPPPRAVVYEPPKFGAAPAPADFSPGPTTEVRTAAHVAPTEEIEPTDDIAAGKLGVARAALSARLRGILARLRPGVHRIWQIIWGRRRAILVGLGVVVVLVAAVVFVLPRVIAPSTPVAVEQPPPAPPEPPPPPPRQLQSEVLGYYEPSYKFTVFDRRFTRLTLRPSASVTFTRPGVRQEVPCEDSNIGRDLVRLRCTLEPYGVVTVEGRFPIRYATTKLDMPVLSANITVTNNRGEVQYRARDQFYWHVPD